MKLLSYSAGGRASWGALADGGVVDLGKRFLPWQAEVMMGEEVLSLTSCLWLLLGSFLQVP